jgi:hypothetical protein
MTDMPEAPDQDDDGVIRAFAEEVRRINVNLPHSMYQKLLVYSKADGISLRNLIYELLKDYLIKKSGEESKNLGSVY